MNYSQAKSLRHAAWPAKESKITADSVRCPWRATKTGHPCGGALIRMQDGAGRLAERMGRVNLKCDKCLQTWSVPITTKEVSDVG